VDGEESTGDRVLPTPDRPVLVCQDATRCRIQGRPERVDVILSAGEKRESGLLGEANVVMRPTSSGNPGVSEPTSVMGSVSPGKRLINNRGHLGGQGRGSRNAARGAIRPTKPKK